MNKLSVTEMVHATCLSGCDYIPRLRGMSLTKAISLTLSWREKVEHTSHYSPPTPYLTLPPPHTHQTIEDISADLTAMENDMCWPKSANQDVFKSMRKGAPGFVNRFYSARAAFLAHRVGHSTLNPHACHMSCHHTSHVASGLYTRVGRGAINR